MRIGLFLVTLVAAALQAIIGVSLLVDCVMSVSAHDAREATIFGSGALFMFAFAEQSRRGAIAIAKDKA